MTDMLERFKKHPVIWSIGMLFGSGLFGSIVGSLVTLYGTQHFAETNAREETQRAYFEGLKALDLEFRRYMTELTATNAPPIDPALIKALTNNLMAQDAQVELLKASLAPGQNAEAFDAYRNSLYNTRKVLLASEDPSDIFQVGEQVGELLERQAEVAEVILQ